MAIQYSGKVVYTTADASSQSSLAADIGAALVNAGWTNIGGVSPWLTITFTGLPSNGSQFLTWDPTASNWNRTYTFKTTLSGANEVLIGATPAQCATNLAEAITAGPGAGTDYGTGTTANALYTATASGANLNVKAIPIDSRTFKVSNWTSNISVPNSGVLYAGSAGVYQSAITPQGFGCRVRLVLATGGNYVGFVFGSYDGSVESNMNEINAGMAALVVASARTLRIFADPYWFCTFLPGSSATPGCVVMGGVPYVLDAHLPLTVTAATNTSPIQVTTEAPNAYVTGAKVFIDGVQGNPAANGLWTVTVIDPNNFTLNGSAGNGNYTGGGLVGDDTSIARIAFASWDTGTDNLAYQRGCWRNNLHCRGGGAFTILNQWHWSSINDGNPKFPFVRPTLDMGNAVASNLMVDDWGNIGDILEPRFAWVPQTNNLGSFPTVGGYSYYKGWQLYDAFLCEKAVNRDVTVSIDGHNWICLTDYYLVSASYSLAPTPQSAGFRGALFLAIT